MIDRQVPEGGQLFLDHTGQFVGDLDRAAEALRRLGFAPTAVNLQQNQGPDGALRPSGTSNRLVMLRRGFLELLAATHETPLADQLRAALARYEGLHLLAFSHADLAGERARLVAAGFAMQPLVHMRRPSPAGGEVAWTILRPEPGQMPEGRIQLVYPHTPDLVWPPVAIEHPNRADSLTGALAVVADPDEARARFARYLGRDAEPDGFVLDRGILRVVGVDEAAARLPARDPPSLPWIAAVAVASADLDETRRVLRANGVRPAAVTDTCIWIAPADALGAWLAFHEAGATPF